MAHRTEDMVITDQIVEPEFLFDLVGRYRGTRAMVTRLLADGEAKCVAVNAAACHLTGYSAAELLALSVWDLARAK